MNCIYQSNPYRSSGEEIIRYKITFLPEHEIIGELKQKNNIINPLNNSNDSSSNKKEMQHNVCIKSIHPSVLTYCVNDHGMRVGDVIETIRREGPDGFNHEVFDLDDVTKSILNYERPITLTCSSSRRERDNAKYWAWEKRKEYKKEFPKGTPLVVACQIGRFDDVKLLLTGHDVEASGVTVKDMVYQVGRGSDGELSTPLSRARDSDIVDYLFAILLDGIAVNANTLTDVYKKAIPKTMWNKTPSPLICACRFGRFEDVQLLITGHDVNGSKGNIPDLANQEGMHTKSCVTYTPLQAATDQAIIDYLFAILLDEKNVNATTLAGEYIKLFPAGTPLVCACEKGRFDHVKLLIKGHGVNQVGKNTEGFKWTPLNAAARYERFDIVQYLIEKCGADPTITNDYGNALHHAASNNKKNTDLILLLLNHMTIDSINKELRWGATPLDRAYSVNRSPIKQDIIDLIRSFGGYSGRKKREERTPEPTTYGGGCCIIS
jgi:hypothetical protein